MNASLLRLVEALSTGAPAVRVVVARVRGSAPREAGATMLVMDGATVGTIGGGHLEYVATGIARGMLHAAEAGPRVDRFSLAASLGQCCGGIVELAFVRHDARDLPLLHAARELARRDPGAAMVTSLEREHEPRHRLIDAAEAAAASFPATVLVERLASEATPLWIFGAGHVGRALVSVLADLDFDITWVDSREGVFPATLPNGVEARQAVEPADEAAGIPPGAWALVMTHSHDEDYALCEALLRQPAVEWLGLIGSKPKATRFRQRLARRGFGEADIARIVTPIGIGGITDKRPAAIAIAVAAQLLRMRESRRQAAVPGVRSA